MDMLSNNRLHSHIFQHIRTKSNMKTATKTSKTPVSSDSDSSSSEVAAPAVKAAPQKTPAKNKSQSSKKVKPESSSDSSESSEDMKPVKKTPGTTKNAAKASLSSAKKAASTPAPKDSSENDDDDSSSSSDEEEPIVKNKKKSKTVSKLPVSRDVAESSKKNSKIKHENVKTNTTNPKKTESSSDDSSSESSSVEASKPVGNGKKVESESSSEDDTSEEDSDGKNAMDVDKELTKKDLNTNNKRKSTEEAGPNKKSSNDNETRLFIKGLPYAATKEEVMSFFEECGKIDSCELPISSGGRPSGTALLTFANKSGAEKALEMDGATFGERWLKIEIANSTSGTSERPKDCTTVFVANYSWNADEDSVRNHFGHCGEITSVRFVTDRETGDFKGFGYVEFVDGESVDEAMKLNGSDFMGRTLRVDFAAQRKESSGGGRRDNGGGRENSGGRGRGRGGRDGGRGRGRGGRDGGRGRGGRFGGDRPRQTFQDFKGKKTSFDD